MMKAVERGRCSASSANGLSCSEIWRLITGTDGGRATRPGIAERTWVMPRLRRTEMHSAAEMSERKRRGTISVGGCGGGLRVE